MVLLLFVHRSQLKGEPFEKRLSTAEAVGYTASMDINIQQMPAACENRGYLYPSGY